MRRVNDWVADKLASFMATMLLFWILLILDVAGAIIDPPSNIQGWLLWGVSIMFQSVALPVLALVSNKQGDRMERKIDTANKTLVDEMQTLTTAVSELKTMHAEQRESYAERDAKLNRILELLEKREKHRW